MVGDDAASRGLALQLSGTGVKYSRGWGIRDCHLDLPAGARAALIGPNGAGKSTLMSVVTGLVSPDEGEVRVLGDIVPRARCHTEVSFLPQGKPLYKSFTVREMVRAAASLNPGLDVPYALEAIDRAQLTPNARLRTLSGGQRSRLALALAMARKPRLLLLDEPFADLDPLARQQVLQDVEVAVSQSAMTILMSSHQLSDVEALCDYLVMMSEGQVQFSGSVQSLLDRHRILVGPTAKVHEVPGGIVVRARQLNNETELLISDLNFAPSSLWRARPASLEEVVLGRLAGVSTSPPQKLQAEDH